MLATLVIASTDDLDEDTPSGADVKAKTHVVLVKNAAISFAEAANTGKEGLPRHATEDGSAIKRNTIIGTSLEDHAETMDGTKEGEEATVDSGDHIEGTEA